LNAMPLFTISGFPLTSGFVDHTKPRQNTPGNSNKRQALAGGNYFPKLFPMSGTKNTGHE